MGLPLQVYGLKRLVRGLSSGRQGARQGYALALGKLLSDVSALPMSQVLEVMSSELDVSGQAKVCMHCCAHLAHRCGVCTQRSVHTSIVVKSQHTANQNVFATAGHRSA